MMVNKACCSLLFMAWCGPSGLGLQANPLNQSSSSPLPCLLPWHGGQTLFQVLTITRCSSKHSLPSI